MKKLLLYTTVTVACTNLIYAQRSQLQLMPSEAIALLKQPIAKTKSSLIDKGYYLVGQENDGSYTFMKGQLEVSVSMKNKTVSIISVQESLFAYKLLLLELKGAGFAFTKSSNPRYKEAPFEAIPSTIIRFDKATSVSCFIISPYNVYQSAEKVITVNYGTYSR